MFYLYYLPSISIGLGVTEVDDASVREGEREDEVLVEGGWVSLVVKVLIGRSRVSVVVKVLVGRSGVSVLISI